MDGLHLEILFIVQCGQVAPLGTAVLQARKFIGQFRLECVEAACPCGDAARNTGCAPAERRALRTSASHRQIAAPRSWRCIAQRKVRMDYSQNTALWQIQRMNFIMTNSEERRVVQ